MKKTNRLWMMISVLPLFGFAAGCATFEGPKSGEDLAASGPTIVDAQAEPKLVELDQNLYAKEASVVVADVKDFNTQIRAVHLRFNHVPLDVPMKLTAGTTWEAQLTGAQLRKLAVSGQAMRYEAYVIATNLNGQTAISSSPVEITVRAPEAVQLGGISGEGKRPN